MNQHKSNMIGLTLGLLSCLGYAIMDTFTKISLSILHIPFISYYLFINYLALLILTVFVIYKYFTTKQNLLKFNSYYIFLSSFCSLGAYISAFIALHDISLDIFYSILFTSPIFLTIFSYFLLGEAINKQKVFSLMVGLIGIMVVINPLNIQANNISLISIILSFNVVILDVCLGIITRKYLQTENTITTRIYTFFIATVLGIIMFLLAGKNNMFDNIGFKGYSTMVSASIVMVVASLWLLKAYQYAPASLVGTTYYSFILWAIIIGIFVFNTSPTLSTLFGCSMIIISNLVSYFNKETRTIK